MKTIKTYGKNFGQALGNVLATQTGYRELLGKDCPRFMNQTVRENARNTRICALGMVIFNGSAALFFLIGFGGPSLPHNFLMRLYVIYATDVLVGISFFIATGFLIRHGTKPNAAWNAAVAFLLVWTFLSGLAADMAHQDHSHHITNIQLALFILALLITLKPLASLAWSAAVALAAFLFIWRIQPDHFMRILTFGNIIFTVVASFILSRIHFSNKVATFQRVCTIESQSQEIHTVRLKNQILNFAIDNKLSPREGEILPLLIRGLSNQAIADMVFVSLDTVKKHVYNIYRKTEVENRLMLMGKIEAMPDQGAQEPSRLLT